jgi:hypothetical protein
LAISLLTFFGLPFALPLFGARAADANLPICCRRNGKHHCAMASMDSSTGRSTSIVAERCPYSIATPPMLVLRSFTPSIAASVFAGITHHPAIAAQTEAQWRVSFDRTRQKRGPPTLIA